MNHISLQLGIDSTVIPRRQQADAAQAHALMPLLAGIALLVNAAQLLRRQCPLSQLVGYADHTIFAAFQNRQMNPIGFVLMSCCLIDGVLKQIADDLVGFIDVSGDL